MAFFLREIEQKIICRYKRLQIRKTILRHNIEAGGISVPDFGLYYKSLVIKTSWYWGRTRNIDEWNKVENPHINPHTSGQLIYAKGDKSIK